MLNLAEPTTTPTRKIKRKPSPKLMGSSDLVTASGSHKPLVRVEEDVDEARERRRRRLKLNYALKPKLGSEAAADVIRRAVADAEAVRGFSVEEILELMLERLERL